MSRPELPPIDLNTASDVPSPCTGVCRLGQRGHCVGCGRDLDEISAWACAPRDARLAICQRAAARLINFPERKETP